MPTRTHLRWKRAERPRQDVRSGLSFGEIPKPKNFESSTSPDSGITYVSISQIAALSYCEQHVVWDHQTGRQRTYATERRATKGTQLHTQFEHEARYLQQTGPLKQTGGLPGREDPLKQVFVNLWKLLVIVGQVLVKMFRVLRKLIFR